MGGKCGGDKKPNFQGKNWKPFFKKIGLGNDTGWSSFKQ